MLFNKALIKKEGEEELESENNNDLTEQDYIQINKDISKALFDMKKEEDKDEDPDESIEENEKELTNFDMDFFSESSNSISMDNNSDISENSFRSANLEMNRNNINLSYEIHNKIKDTIKLNNNDINNNNQLNEFQSNNKFANKSKNSSNTSIVSEPEKKIIYNRTSSFPSMDNERRSTGFNSRVDNLNNSFNCSPYNNNFNNNLFNNYPIKSKHINNDNNNIIFKKNIKNFINNNINNIDFNIQDKNQSNINNINYINNNNNIKMNNMNSNSFINNSMNNINGINLNNNLLNNLNMNKMNNMNNMNNLNNLNNNINNNMNNNMNNMNNMNILNYNNNQILNNNMNNINPNYNIIINNNGNINNINQNYNLMINNNGNLNNNNFCSMSEGSIPHHSNKDNVDSPKNIIHIENILKSKDKRTTLIIRNIPNRYTITLLLQEINKNYYRKYDVVYLPQDFINNSNLGFGFINFLDHMYLVMFYEEFVGKKWNCFNSNKRCQLAYSKYQGKNELTKYIHKKLGISSHYNSNENLKKSFYINNEDRYPRPLIEIPIKYYRSFHSYYPFSLCHVKDDKIFVVEKYFNF